MSDLEQKANRHRTKKDSHVSDSLASDTLKNVFKAAGKEKFDSSEVPESEAGKKKQRLSQSCASSSQRLSSSFLATAVPLLTGGLAALESERSVLLPCQIPASRHLFQAVWTETACILTPQSRRKKPDRLERSLPGQLGEPGDRLFRQ